MSSLDRVDLGTLRSCCIRTAHARPGLAADGDTITCPGCGAALAFRSGRWTNITDPAIRAAQ